MSERDLTSGYEDALDDGEVALAVFVEIDWPSSAEDSITLVNPGFETGDLTGWTTVGTPTVDPVFPISGTYSLHLDEAGGGTADRVDATPYIRVVEGEVFKATAIFRRNASDLPSNSATIRFRYRDATDGFVAFSSPASASAATSGNQTVTLTATVPSGVSSMTVTIQANSAGTGSWHVDDVTLERLHTVARFWSGIGTILWNSLPWYGTGELGSIDKIAESVEKTDNGVELVLNYLDDDIRNEVNTNDPIGSDASIYLNVMDVATGAVTESKEVFTGFVDRVEVEDAGSTGSVTVRLAHESARLKRSTFFALSDAHQQYLFAGDLGMEFAARMDVPIVWGRYPTPVYSPDNPYRTPWYDPAML